jgi:hypothetical protein
VRVIKEMLEIRTKWPTDLRSSNFGPLQKAGKELQKLDLASFRKIVLESRRLLFEPYAIVGAFILGIAHTIPFERLLGCVADRRGRGEVVR